jgi:hypothetical protein
MWGIALAGMTPHGSIVIRSRVQTLPNCEYVEAWRLANVAQRITTAPFTVVVVDVDGAIELDLPKPKAYA